MIKPTLYSICLLAVLFVLGDRFIYLGLMYNNDFKTARITRSPINSNTLFHGPCEPEWMMDPTIIDSITGLKSFNLALNHSDFADNYLHLYLYLQHQPKPAYLFLYVTPESMDSSLANQFNTYRFVPFLADSVVKETIKENDKDYYRFCKIPLIRYTFYNNFVFYKSMNGWKHKLTKRETAQHKNGYTPAINPYQLDFRQPSPKNHYLKWYPLREKYLRKTIELALKNKIKIFLYESPVLEESKFSNLNRYDFINRIQKLASEYNIEYLLFDDLPMAKQNENYFSALNTTLKGSNEFSIIFSEYIVQNILSKGNKQDKSK